MKKFMFAGVFAILLIVTFSSVSSAQGTAFIWLRYKADVMPAGYTKVTGGLLKDGTVLYVCRGALGPVLVPGKFYNNQCVVPYNGKEYPQTTSIDLLATNTKIHWKQVHDLSKAQIRSNGVYAAPGQVPLGNQYICRKKMSDGIHPGKYAIGNGFCYVSWAGKETYSGDDFEILWHD